MKTLTNDRFEKKLIIIDLVELFNGHSAERVQETIMKILNKLKFKKNKIKAILF